MCVCRARDTSIFAGEHKKAIKRLLLLCGAHFYCRPIAFLPCADESLPNKYKMMRLQKRFYLRHIAVFFVCEGE
jgi:hypothetical protein